MSQVSVLYKTIMLYLLNRSEMPLSTSIISEFFISGNYTDYFMIQELIGELNDESLIEIATSENTSTHSITEKGVQTLSYMQDRISDKVRSEVSDFLLSHDFSIRQTHTLFADYERASMGGYQVHLRARDGEIIVMDLSLHISSEAGAKAICTNWKNNHEAVYAMLIDSLMS